MSDTEFDDELSNFSDSDNSFAELNNSRFTKKNKKSNNNNASNNDHDPEQDEEESESDDENENEDDDLDDLNSDILDELSDFDDEDDEDDDMPSKKKNKNKQPVKQNTTNNNKLAQNIEAIDDYDSDGSDDSDEENYRTNGFLSGNNYLKKFNKDIINDYIAEHHPECIKINHTEASALSTINKNSDGFIIDPKHRTTPILSKYELTRILGIRASQLATNPTSFLPKDKLPNNLIDPLEIAKLEFTMGKLPFLIKRPLGNNKFEIWKLSDLKVLSDVMLNLESLSELTENANKKVEQQMHTTTQQPITSTNKAKQPFSKK